MVGFKVGGLQNVDALMDSDPDNDDDALNARKNPVGFLQAQLAKTNIDKKLKA